MASGTLQDDPHGKREAEKYERPVHSREMILNTSRNAARPLPIRSFAKNLISMMKSLLKGCVAGLLPWPGTVS